MTTQIVHAPAGINTPKGQEAYFHMLRKYNTMREASVEMGRRMVRGVAAAATGVILGYIDGRYDYAEVHGIPMAGLVGIGGTILGVFLDGEIGEIVSAAGMAGSAVWGRDWGADLGRTQKQKAGQQGQTKASGSPGQLPGNTIPSGYTNYPGQSQSVSAGRF